jgi:hypothetical protein
VYQKHSRLQIANEFEIIIKTICIEKKTPFIPFSADVANKRHLVSAPKSHFCDLTGKIEVIGLPDLMTLFIDLGCLYCKQTQRAFNVFKNTLKRLKIDSVDQKLFRIHKALERLALRETLRFHSWR